MTAERTTGYNTGLAKVAVQLRNIMTKNYLRRKDISGLALLH